MAERSLELQSIVDQINIVDHISRYETLKQEGNHFVGVHGHTDSKGKRCLTVHPDTQSWYCWHCCKGGTVFDYEIHRQGIDFAAAVDCIGDLYKIERTHWTPEQREQFKREQAERAPVQDIMMEAFRGYHDRMTDDHRNYYHKRGLTDPTIDENLLGYAQAGGRWLVERLGKKYQKDLLLKTGLFFRNDDGTLRDRYSDRYVIPYWYQGKIVFSIGRSLNPQIEAHKKYVKHLVHSDKYPYVSQVAVKHILWGEDGIQRGKPILVAEGIIDALLAKQELGDTYCVASPVTTKISNAQIERIADLAKVKGASEIIFVPDNEISKAGEQGAFATAQKIRERWQVEIEEERAKKQWRPALKIAKLPRPPELDKIDLADYLSQRKVDEVRYWIEAARPLERFEQYIKGDPRRFFWGRSFTPKYMADEIRTEGSYYLYTAQQLYRYRNGVYVPDESDTARMIQAKLKDRSRDAHINETLKFLGVASSGIDGTLINPDCGKLNLANKILDLATGKVESHTPDFYSTVRIPVIYDPSSTCPQIDKFFREVLPADCLDLMDEIAGYCLIQTTRFQRAFMLTGSGANGKSTLLNLLTEFLGDANVSKVPLQELDENRFKRAELFGKLANIFADLDSRALQASTYFKTIVTGDPIDAERKFKDPFSFRPFCKLIFSANEIPKSNDRTFAYYRRWIIIPFPNKFEGTKDNKNLIDELTTPEELSGLFNRALRGLERLIRRQEFSENETTRKALERYKTQNDNVKEFLEEHCEVRMESEVEREDLYGRYKNFCEVNKYGATSQRRFNERIEALYPQVKKDRANDDKKTAIWKNLAFIG